MNTLTDTNQLIAERAANMPAPLAALFTSGILQNSTAGVQSLHDLTDQQRVTLENELTVTFLGLEFISTLEQRITSSLELPTEDIVSILEDLAVMMLTPEVMGYLNEIEAAIVKAEAAAPKPIPPKNQPPQPAPPPPKAPQPPTPPTESVRLREQPKTPSGGKDIGLQSPKTKPEPAIAGMRTMRLDVTRLRGDETTQRNPTAPAPATPPTEVNHVLTPPQATTPTPPVPPKLPATPNIPPMPKI